MQEEKTGQGQRDEQKILSHYFMVFLAIAEIVGSLYSEFPRF